MYEKDLALHNPQWLICHKNQAKPNSIAPQRLTQDFMNE